MSKPSSPLRRFLQAFISSLEPKPASVIYAVGVITWVAAMIIQALQSDEGGLFYTLLGGSNMFWQLGFLWSLFAVAVAALVYVFKAGRPIWNVLAYMVVYASPCALLLIGMWTLDAIYFQHPATVETNSMLDLTFVVFYIIGIIYMRLRASRDKEEAHLFFLLPTFTVVALLISLTAYRLFTSNDYIYRNAFQIAIQSVDRTGDPIKITGTLILNKGGNYSFAAFENQTNLIPEDEASSPLSIQWANGAQTPSAEGEYDFSIALPQSDVAKQQSREMFSDEPMDPDFGGPEIYFQINKQGDDQKIPEPLRSLPIWLADFAP